MNEAAAPAPMGHNAPPLPLDFDAKGPILLVEEIDDDHVFQEENMRVLVEEIVKTARAIPPDDVSTKTGRDAIISRAARITRCKTALDDRGKIFVAGIKTQAKVIDEARRFMRDTLDGLRDEIRKPVTDIEEREKEAAAALAAKIHAIAGMDMLPLTVVAHEQGLKDLEAIKITEEEYGDRAGDAALAKEEARAKITARLENLRDDEERRKAEKAKREAEEQARVQAEAKAAAERAAAMEEQAKRDIEEAKVKAAREAQERVEREAKAKADAEAARKAAEEAAERARAADADHRMSVNNSALIAMLKVLPDLSVSDAKKLVIAIIKQQIPNVRIDY